VATATDTRTSPDRLDPAADASLLDVTPAELEQLVAALDGDWVAVLISLWPSWGFCPAHAFGFAITEVELQPRTFTTGPFRTAILYEHFLEGAAKIAGARPRTWRGIRLFLSPRADCFICDRLASTNAAATHDRSPDWKTLARQVNQRQHVHEQIEEARPNWTSRACPLCVPGGGGIVCRPHLLGGTKQQDLSAALIALSARLRQFVRSMTAAKAETRLLDRFSWIETLSWFAGWDHTQRLMLEKSHSDER
jgi:hypothetical protein